MKVKLSNVCLAFPDLYEARAFKPGDKPKYKATFLLPKDDPQIKTIEAAILATATEAWKDKAATTIKSIRSNPNKFCFQDGDTKEYDGYTGMLALSAGNTARPLVIDQQKNPLAPQDGKPYAGCFVNASIEFFAYDNSGKGISASLRGVQFAHDGDAFGGGTPASPDEFDDLGMQETVDDLS
jgi:hypothetical protein